MTDTNETVPGQQPAAAPAADATQPIHPQDATTPPYPAVAPYGPVPAAPSVPARPSRRTLGIVAGVIGGVLLVGAGFGTGLVVGHLTARRDGPTGFLSRVDQRGELRGPGYGPGEQLRPFGGHDRRGAGVPAPALPTPAPSS